MNTRLSAMCVLLLLGSISCVAHAGNINGEATYVSFAVPGAMGGTLPLAINASMTVTGAYYINNTRFGAFIRTADGTITTFTVPGAFSILAQSINAAGDITGSYLTSAAANAKRYGFLRYADGRVVSLDSASGDVDVYVNDFDEIAGDTAPGDSALLFGFTRSRSGVLSQPFSFGQDTLVTGINASGNVVGYANIQALNTISFVVHSDGYTEKITVAPSLAPGCGAIQTLARAINASGKIAGYYSTNCPPPGGGVFSSLSGGFMMSPDGVSTLFSAPGTMDENLMAMDDLGDVTGAYAAADGTLHGFVRNPYGTLTSFDPTESDAKADTQPTGINDAGVITGYYAQAGTTAGFLRIPYRPDSPQP